MYKHGTENNLTCHFAFEDREINDWLEGKAFIEELLGGPHESMVGNEGDDRLGFMRQSSAVQVWYHPNEFSAKKMNGAVINHYTYRKLKSVKDVMALRKVN